jgi:hypothetical protein
VSLRDEAAGAPTPLPEVEDALRSGAAVTLPIADLLGSLGELTGGGDPLADGVPEGLLDDLRAAVEPHARLTDLGSDDGERRVTVEVDVERLLAAVTRTLDEVVTELEHPDTLGLRDGTVTGTLTIQDGHYRRLDLRLAEVAALRTSTDVELPDFGESRLVVELDDTAAPVEAPPRVADLDLLELLGSHDSDVPPLDDALVECLERATTESTHAACLETA